MKTISASWALVALVVTVSPTSAASLVEWQLDGEKLDAETGFDVQPGKLHELRVKLVRPDSLAEITLARTLPTGRTVTEKGRLDADRPELDFQLGPLTSPALYEFESGVVFRKGHRFEFAARPADAERPVERLSFYQGLAERRSFEHFVPGDKTRVVYRTATAPGRYRWEWAVSMAPPLMLRLEPRVLVDQNRLAIQYASRIADASEGTPCVLRVTGVEGKELCRHEVTAKAGPATKKWPGPKPAWESISIDPSDWAPGAYTIELWPRIGGRLWQEGPTIIYHRREAEPNAISVSPYAPWLLTRDPARPSVQ
jgi:hypothetical protein